MQKIYRKHKNNSKKLQKHLVFDAESYYYNI